MNYGSISSSNSSIQSLAADAQSLGNLKMEAGKNSAAAIKETAKQFESLFMRELMKSMREATMKSGMLDSAGGDLGADLLDQQLSVHMSGM
ncbi:MAG TPA: rod-binding protein, partial [Rhodoferax sp.]|nr:rod-binding protein [Rhodoferax sp.]